MEQQEDNNQQPADAYSHLEESEPYLGPAWAVAMLVLYLLKRQFPAETYSWLWWFQSYIIGIVVAITIFTLLKRHQFYKAEKLKLQQQNAVARNLPNRPSS